MGMAVASMIHVGVALVRPRSELVTPSDLVIPAAIEGTLKADVASQLTARLVVDCANRPTTPRAEATLHRAGVAVVPDLIANAGG